MTSWWDHLPFGNQKRFRCDPVKRARIRFSRCSVVEKSGRIRPVNYWAMIADNLSKAGWSWGCISTINSHGALQLLVDRPDVTSGYHHTVVPLFLHSLQVLI